MARTKQNDLPAAPSIPVAPAIAVSSLPLVPRMLETPVVNPGDVIVGETVLTELPDTPAIEVAPESRVLKVKHRKTGNEFEVSRDYYDRHKSILECL